MLHRLTNKAVVSNTSTEPMVENLLTIFHASISNKKMYLQKCAPKEVCTFLQSVHLKNCKKVRVLRMLRQTMYMEKPQINPSRVNTNCFKTLFRIHLFRTALQDFNVSAHSSRIACICLAQFPSSENCNGGFLATCLGSTRKYRPNLIHIPIHITCSLDVKALFFCSEFCTSSQYHGAM